jgi:5-formaminoimidazole-4-carboxamide-1-beta-D-ribofuranosyl 5'-monophosphate synthetase
MPRAAGTNPIPKDEQVEMIVVVWVPDAKQKREFFKAQDQGRPRKNRSGFSPVWREDSEG